MKRLPQKPAPTGAGFSAIWIDREQYLIAHPGSVTGAPWPTPPAFDDPAKLISWCVQRAAGGTWRGQELAFSVLLAPDVAEAFGIPAVLPKTADTLWEKELMAAGWTFKSKGCYGPWTVIQGGNRRQIEIGLCVVPWIPTSFRARAAHGLVHHPDGAIDVFGTMFAHAYYRLLTGWPLSGGAGMAGAKALWRWPRKKKVYWAPPAEAWADMKFLHSQDPADHTVRSTQRPWHLSWTAYPNPPEQPELQHVTVWDQQAAYLAAWSGARFARGALIHTGTGVRPGPGGKYPAGYYQVRITWCAELAPVVAKLPPVHGSRDLLPDGSVWITHEILDGLDAINAAMPQYAPVAHAAIYDSWTCEDYGQIAKAWGTQVHKALMFARQEPLAEGDEAMAVLAQAVKVTYAQGYPLLERGGIMRRPDHVDGIIDHMGMFGRFLRVLHAAVTRGLYPLDVSADEITMPCGEDPAAFNPLAKAVGDTMYRIKTNKDGTPRTATRAQWAEAHADGRAGRWWIPVAGTMTQASRAARRDARAEARERIDQGSDSFLDYLMDYAE